jgi:ribosomal protein L9
LDIRVYFQKLQALEQSIGTPWVLVVSEETTNGGKAGILTEVKRSVGARLILTGKARLATESEIEEYRAEQTRERTAAEQASMAGRVQIAILSDQELRALKSSMRQKG